MNLISIIFLYYKMFVHSLMCISLAVFSTAHNNFSATQGYIRMVLDTLSVIENDVFQSNNSALLITDENKYDFGTYDFIIVGAGAAGTLLANRLSEISGWNVLLLEAGDQDIYFSGIPGLAGGLILSGMSWNYKSIPQHTFGLSMMNREVAASRGKVLGGGSVIDCKMYIRGNKHDYDKWAQMGNDGWSYEEVLPSFLKFENYAPSNGDDGYHGYSGPLHLNFTEPTLYTRLYIDAMKELGYPEVDYNGRTQIGVSQALFNVHGKTAQNGRRAFIKPILGERKNFHLSLKSFVTKVLIEKESKRAYGVTFVKDGKEYTARCTKEVILSAGAFNTPQILMLSGIGPKSELEKIDVEPITSLPVGQNMQDHAIYLGLIFRTNTTIFNETLTVALRNYYLHSQRPLTAPYNIDCLSFYNVFDKNSSIPNIENILVVPPGLLQNPGRYLNFNNQTQEDYAQYNPNTDFAIFPVLLNCKSRGQVTMKSNNPRDGPNIDFNLFSDVNGEDIETMYQGILQALKITDTQAFKSINATFISLFRECSNFDQKSRQYWECAIRHFSGTGYHSVGTTRMGTSPLNSVVNPRLKVHGIQGLRVVDAGVIPEITSGHLNAPTYMIAQRISEFIKSEYNE